MADDLTPATPEIAHVLFVDIVGYSTESTTAQAKGIRELTESVSSAPAYIAAKSRNAVLSLPAGDGMALLFFDDVFAPVRCAIHIRQTCATVKVRCGIHSGLVQRQIDIAGADNVVGEGINTAARVMDFGEADHILLSEQHAGWLTQFDEWASYVYPLGEAVAKHGLRLALFNFYGDNFGRPDRPARVPAASDPAPEHPDALKIVMVYRRKAEPDDALLDMLETALAGMGHDVFVDRHLKIGVEWAATIGARIRAADVVVALLSAAAASSEMLEYEIETALDEHAHRGKPLVLPVHVGADAPPVGAIVDRLSGLNFAVWHGPQDDRKVVAALVSAITEPPRPHPEHRHLEPVGGAVPPDSKFYVVRPTDDEFAAALRANESILLVKGPRQVGKTSLLGQGACLVADLDWRFATSDFQKLSASHLASDNACYRLLAALLARQLKFDYDFDADWLDVFGANLNLDNFVRALLESSEAPLVWFMDEADRLFGAPFAGDFFGLVRSWHNSRATEPGGPWRRFTVVIAYATEAHLFIQDLNQSPFNVGRQLPLANFTLGETADLNQRYGSPVGDDQVQRLWELIGGQPFLTRRALDLLSRQVMDFPTLVQTSARDDGPFGDHLKRILVSVSQMPEVLGALRASIANPDFRDSEGVQRLISAGIAQQTSGHRIKLMCELYRTYLASQLAGSPD